MSSNSRPSASEVQDILNRLNLGELASVEELSGKSAGATVVETPALDGREAGWEGWLVPALGNAAEAAEQTKREASRRAAPVSSPDTIEKDRAELMAAIHRKNFLGLTEVLAREVDVNFIIEKYGSWQSPLGFATQNDWIDGVLSLVRAGAVESIARARHHEADKDATPEERRGRAYNFKRWKYIRSWQILESLIHSETEPEQLEYLALSAIHESRKALVLLTADKQNLLSQAQWAALEKTAFTDLSTRQVAEGNISLIMLDSLWKKMPERLAASSDIRWEVAIRADKPRLIATLAKNGAQAPKNWSGFARSVDFPDIARPDGMAQLARMASESPEGASAVSSAPLESEEKGAKKIPAPLWALAALRGSTEALAVLGEVPAIREAALADPRTPVFMAFVARPDVLKEAARQGLDLKMCVSANKETPMHTACAGYCPSKTHLLDMARLCPDWLAVKNKRGFTPLELLAKTAEGRDDTAKAAKLVADIERATLKKDLRDIKSNASAEKKAAKARGEKPAATRAVKKAVSRRL